MKDKFPEIYKRKIDNLKSKIQQDFYYHAPKDNENSMLDKKEKILKEEETKSVSKMDLINKINGIFKRPDYVYQADVIIMYKNGENIEKKIIGFKDNYIMTYDGEKIHVDEINDIK